jgi:hypothetical protein
MAKASLAVRRATRAKQEKVEATKPLGEGSRFAAVEAAAKAGGAKNPAAVAAAVGRKKYGQKRMTAMAVKGKKAAK